MQMFDNFLNKPSDYIPNNMFKKPIARQATFSTETLHPIYRRGKVFAYWWNWGDSISLDVKNEITVYFPNDSIVVSTSGQEPDEHTIGQFTNQKYYNITDIKSYTLAAIIGEGEPEDKLYIWKKDEKFTYDTWGTDPVVLEIPSRENEQFVVQLFDFRKEKIREDIYTTIPFKWTISPDESLRIQQGIYTLNIHSEIRSDDVSTELRLTNSYPIYVMFNGYLDARSFYLYPQDNPYAALAPGAQASSSNNYVTVDMLATVAFTGMWNDLGQDGEVTLDGDGYDEGL